MVHSSIATTLIHVCFFSRLPTILPQMSNHATSILAKYILGHVKCYQSGTASYCHKPIETILMRHLSSFYTHTMKWSPTHRSDEVNMDSVMERTQSGWMAPSNTLPQGSGCFVWTNNSCHCHGLQIIWVFVHHVICTRTSQGFHSWFEAQPRS